MQIENQEIVSTPKDIQEKIQKLRDQISINEQEVLRFRKLRVSEEYTISELIKQKSELENFIAELISEKEKKEHDNTELKKEVAREVQSLDQLRQEAENIRKQQEEKKAEISDRENILLIGEQKLAENQKNLNESMTRAKQAESELNIKIDLLNGVINQICT